ncbi:unnamed protein product [Callosobruchus maculatus]|uniref:Regulatory protein zeste n=1 Tax=Callosobruchus maculatus TaxID=64391 RepID=A0A653CGQ9_CALMS|nr:unnamed protein product [Callosobruchus maculatus]
MSKCVLSDTELFIQILAKYNIVEDNKSESDHNEKKEAWINATEEFNAEANEKRTMVELRQWWHETIKPSMSKLVKEEYDEMATDVAERPCSSDSIRNNLVYDVDVKDDSDGIYYSTVEVTQKAPKQEPGTSSISLYTTLPTIVKHENIKEEQQISVVKAEPLEQIVHSASMSSQYEPSPSTSKEQVIAIEEETPSLLEISRKRSSDKRKELLQLKLARLRLIQQETRHLEELHKIKLEEAHYQREAARLARLRQELKLKKLRKK